MELKILQFNPINEKISFNYTIPKNKEELMYDFYLLTSLPLWLLDGSGTTAPVAEGPAMKMLAKEAQTKLVDYLKDDLLDVVFYAIASEFRHAFGFGRVDEIEKVIGRGNMIKYLKNTGLVPPRGIKMLQQDLKDKSYHYPQQYMKRADHEKFFDTAGRKISYKAVKKTFSDKKFVELCEKLFMADMWKSKQWISHGYNAEYKMRYGDYGGPAWKGIAKGWLKLNAASTYDKKVVYIDHVFDLQHNTDSVLNKSKDYADDYGEHDWIRAALETKKHAKPMELVLYASGTLKSFAARVIKAATGDTFEKWSKVPNDMWS
jgi:hypothetical protein